MPQVEFGLDAVFSNKTFAVLFRIQQSRINIQIRIALLHRHRQPLGLQHRANRRRGNSLANAG